jgi:hypothetical protein
MGRVSAIVCGLMAGGLLGAAARPAVVYAVWLREADVELSQAILFVSAAIGLTVGVIAVVIAAFFRSTLASAVIGAASGAILAYAVTILTFLPLFWSGLLGIDGIRTVGNEAPFYGAAMAAAGALSGGCGAFLQGWLGGERPGTASGH